MTQQKIKNTLEYHKIKLDHFTNVDDAWNFLVDEVKAGVSNNEFRLHTNKNNNADSDFPDS